ncbi:amidohydrolase family protein [Marilutibacter chinensis]|uniref:Amidohydrolase family protein n=1 Tax=Marilutibacter chinensis TaxID=2912247 RepID=A0ABS9HR45_9GAMM|nr:amidohydrolase family protein [Lysobacter chinensis]
MNEDDNVQRIGMRGGGDPSMKWIRSCVFSFALLVAGVAPAQELALVNARVYPDPQAAPIENATVLMRDGRIVELGTSVALPDGVAVIDAEGGTVTAGFWNSHAHTLPLPLREADTRTSAELGFALRQLFTRWGFTTVFDIASFPSDNAATLRRRIAAGEMAGPALLTVGMPFFPADGTPSYVEDMLDGMGAPSAEVATDREARERARRQLEGGSDGVKLFIGAIVDEGRRVQVMDTAIARAVVDATHAAGKPAFAHPTTREGIEVALASGVDVLAHTTPTDGPWSPALAQRLVDAGVALTPTLALFEVEVRKERAPEEVVARISGMAQQQLRIFHESGGQVLFGTDVGYIDLPDTRRELELMAGAGMDWRAILASLTTAPVQRFGHSARKGRVEVGMDADLVVLARDPARDPTAFSDVRHTIRAGEVIHSAHPNAAPEPGHGNAANDERR